MLGIAWAVDLLKAVPKVVAAAPEFKRLYDQLVATFNSDTDQAAAKEAYDVAISDAADAHQDLDDIVARNS